MREGEKQGERESVREREGVCVWSVGDDRNINMYFLDATRTVYILHISFGKTKCWTRKNYTS